MFSEYCCISALSCSFEFLVGGWYSQRLLSLNPTTVTVVFLLLGLWLLLLLGCDNNVRIWFTKAGATILTQNDRAMWLEKPTRLSMFIRFAFSLEFQAREISVESWPKLVELTLKIFQHLINLWFSYIYFYSCQMQV